MSEDLAEAVAGLTEEVRALRELLAERLPVPAPRWKPNGFVTGGLSAAEMRDRLATDPRVQREYVARGGVWPEPVDEK